MATTDHHPKPPVLSRGTIIAGIVLSVAGFLVYTGHGVHLLGFLPYLLILACPLMHIFMHGHQGHGGSGCHGNSGDSAAAPDGKTQGDSGKENQP